jgi:hypothetical protein|tara:strand:- start:264 stop:479 length:216 start_codon:yes stop_codon:yes gene_type:complete
MYVPEFNSVEDVQRFLRYGGDAWCLPMVEEYMELVALDTSVEDIDVEELNGWIQHEMLAATEGYEEWSSKE